MSMKEKFELADKEIETLVGNTVKKSNPVEVGPDECERIAETAEKETIEK